MVTYMTLLRTFSIHSLNIYNNGDPQPIRTACFGVQWFFFQWFFLLVFKMNFLYFMLHPLTLVLGQNWEQPGSLFFTALYQVLLVLIKAFVFFPRLHSTSFFNLSFEALAPCSNYWVFFCFTFCSTKCLEKMKEKLLLFDRMKGCAQSVQLYCYLLTTWVLGKPANCQQIVLCWNGREKF